MDPDPARIDRAVAAVQAGDTAALHYLYVAYADDVCGYVRSIVRSHHDAEDVTQSIFLKLPQAIRRYEPQGLPFQRWLMRVARNSALDWLRARRQIPCAEIYCRDEARDDATFETRECLREALQSLPQEQREVVILRHAIGLTPPEIADQLNRSEASVHGLHHRGRRRLRRALEETGTKPLAAVPAA
jgi:RNA polymerase sigma-70 factor (ECF subfamily)